MADIIHTFCLPSISLILSNVNGAQSCNSGVFYAPWNFEGRVFYGLAKKGGVLNGGVFYGGVFYDPRFKQQQFEEINAFSSIISISIL